MIFKFLSLGLCISGAALVSPLATAHEKISAQTTPPQRQQKFAPHETGLLHAQPAASIAERSSLLIDAEAALSQGNIDIASQKFERASLIAHTAEAELGLTRALMQAGEYRRALSFAAHTAGAHLDEAEGAALYAWLLHIGGQGTVAQRVLSESTLRSPADPLLATARQQLHAPFPLAVGGLLNAPTRFAPYSPSSTLPPTAHVTGSGVLIDGGMRALVPAASLARSRTIWVRNGLGNITKAIIEHKFAEENIVVLRLDKALPMASKASFATHDAFPGSLAYNVEYAPLTKSLPAWPLLSSGFIGAPIDNSRQRNLGIELPQGARGGPVFNKIGQVIGIAVRADKGMDKLIPASVLQERLGMARGSASSDVVALNTSVDEIYEIGMRVAVQIITSR